MALPKRVVEAFTCQNVDCGKDLGRDHVTVVTTSHIRRFCSMYCVVDGFNAHMRDAGIRINNFVDQLHALRETAGWTDEKEAAWIKANH